MRQPVHQLPDAGNTAGMFNDLFEFMFRFMSAAGCKKIRLLINHPIIRNSIPQILFNSQRM